ncbi:MAG: hypothetical protein JST54_07225 [Deltaproteobacteria bacterium]|nr:hypothetical protein [Deltaproteobacteria bacterium]
MSRLGPASLAVLVVGLCACNDEGLWSAPRDHVDEGTTAVTGSMGTTTHGSGNGTGNSSGTSSTTSSNTTGSGSTGTSSTTSTSTSGSTTGANCTHAGAAPTLSCSRSDGLTTWLPLGSDVHLGCTLTGNTETPSSFSGQDALGYFTVDGRSAPDVVTVGLSDAQVPNTFADTQVSITITANLCDEQNAQAVVTLPVLGNSVIADHYRGLVEVYSSAATDKGLFAGAAFSGRPNMVANLPNGDILIGGWNDTVGTGFIVEVDRNGQLVHTFDATDASSNTLYPGCSSGGGCEMMPWGATQAPDGKIWVSVNESAFSAGHLYRFTSNGAYYDEVPAPTNQSSVTWVPMGSTLGPGGEIIVANGYQHAPPYIAVFPAGSTVGNYVPLDMKTCVSGQGCSDPSFNEMALADVWWDGQNTLYVANTNDDDNDSDLGAFDASTFNFLRGTVHPSNAVNDRTNNSYGFRALTGFGDNILLSVWSGCGWTIDPQTLYPLGPGPGINQNGCAVGDQSVIYDPRGIAHFGAQ